MMSINPSTAWFSFFFMYNFKSCFQQLILINNAAVVVAWWLVQSSWDQAVCV